MLKISKKQNKIRQQLWKQELYNLTMKFIKPFLIEISPIKIKQYLQQIVVQQSKRTTYTRLRSICLLTGRSRSVYRLFTLSRSKIREYASAGYFVGIKKSQW